MSIRIQRADFDISAEIVALKSKGGETGAIVTFTGVVRGEEGLTALHLEHYPGMTEREIARHVEEAQRRWSILAATVIHRVGTLRAGDNIVLVAVGASHRKPAFEAAEFLMDYLKARAPFWKEEHRGTEHHWVEPRGSDDAAATRWDQE